MDLSFSLDSLNDDSASTASRLEDIETMLQEGVTWDYNPFTNSFSMRDLGEPSQEED